jgi:hypothetical protein
MIIATQIVEEAAAKGVVLALDPSGKMMFYGTLPPDWTDLSKAWLADRASVITYLLEPSTEHRTRIGKAMAAAAKTRAGVKCVSLGELIEERPSCGCGARHQCAIHGECVVSGNGGGRWKVCTQCLDFKELS